MAAATGCPIPSCWVERRLFSLSRTTFWLSFLKFFSFTITHAFGLYLGHQARPSYYSFPFIEAIQLRRGSFYVAIDKDFAWQALVKEYGERIYGIPKSVICGRLPSIVSLYRAFARYLTACGSLYLCEGKTRRWRWRMTDSRLVMKDKRNPCENQLQKRSTKKGVPNMETP